VKLDLGSGPEPREGYEGVDITAYEGVPHQVDLFSYPWPFADHSVTEVQCHHFVEHVPDLVGFMGELYRVMTDGGQAFISHPYQFHVRAWQDPTHVRSLNEVSWFYFDADWRKGRSDISDTVDFEVVDITAIPSPEWETMSKEDPEGFERAARNMINVIADLHVILQCRK
jgi:SAM-dependent methyltransferase